MNTLKYIKGSKNDTKHDQYEFECWHSKQKNTYNINSVIQLNELL